MQNKMSSNTMFDDDTTMFDIIIVGAGLSGLVAAFRILKKDATLKVLVLEASHRCGGQILSGAEGELGAKWIDESHHHIRRLCDELGIPLVCRRNDESNLKRKWDIDHGVWSLFANYELNRFIKYIDTISPEYFRGSSYQYLPSGSMESFICKCLFFESSRRMMRILVRAICGLTTACISCNEFLMLCNANDGLSVQLCSITGSGVQYTIVPNFERIIEALLEQIPVDQIVRNAKVSHVLQYSNSVYVKTVGELEFRASLMIMAIPFQDVQRIQFIPHIPTEQEANLPPIRNMVTSFVARYVRPYWRQRGQSGSYFLHSPMVICYETQPLTISGVIYHHENASDDLVPANCVLRMFHQNFGSNATPVHWQHATWEQAVVLSVQPRTVCDRLIWASSCTGVQYRGYANGAVQSGMRATMLALLELRPQLLTWQDVTEIEHANALPRSVGLFDRFLASLNLYNCTIWALTAAAFISFNFYTRARLSGVVNSVIVF